jgi:heme/copper-type cytochrome/quinol oxidase subunit 1/heme/copper-type cytochrome/quinol oxidase subunit 3
MVFLFAMPVLAGLANYLVPLMIGARDMIFPRLNAFSYWLYLTGSLLLFSSFFLGGAPDTGWFSYAPLTERLYSAHDGVDFWIVSLVLLGISSIIGALNVIMTVSRLRAPGMRLKMVPMFVYANYVNGFLILFAIPSLTAGLVMLYLDRHFDTAFFNVAQGGDPVIWQHLFWFFGHPEVYILILPVFGILSEVVPVFSRKPLFGRTTMMAMILFIAFQGFLVWAHHMFAAGIGSVFDIIFAGSTMVIAVPTGVKIFNWLATMWGGSLRFKTPLYFTSGMIALFTIGGLTGVTLAAVPFDWQVTDSYYVVAHFHNTLFGGTLLGVMAGVFYWYPKVTGRMLNDRLGKACFWSLFIGFNLTFMPLYVVGLLGMPRRVYTWAPGLGWEPFNLLASIGGFVIALGVILLFYNLATSLRRGAIAGGDPWDAWTLEWAATSPPPPTNFTQLPAVRSSRPLWDVKNPERSDEPMSKGGRAVTLSDEQPPAQSSAPILVALGLVGLAGGLLGEPLIAALAALFAFAGLVFWTWEPWHSPEEEASDAGLPSGGGPSSDAGPLSGLDASAAAERAPRGRRPAGVNGTLLFIGSEAVFFGALFYTYLHLRVRADVWPPAGIPHLEAGLPVLNTVILLASGLFAHWGLVGLTRGRRDRYARRMIVAMALGLTFLGIQIYEYANVGFSLSDGIMGSTFFTITGFHGAHVAAGVVLLGIGVVRILWGRGERSPSRLELGLAESGTYYWHFVDAVWLVVLTLVYLLPATFGIGGGTGHTM